MKVLHDWDDPYLNWKWAALIGIKYLIYAFFNFFGFKPKCLKNINNELKKYSETLIKLDKLCGVTPIFGIRDIVVKKYPNIYEILLKLDNIDIRKHTHIGESYIDPDSKRCWNPPLKQSKNTWHYDKNYVDGKKIFLNDGELPIWHVDRPYYLDDYIDFLYNVIIQKESIYKK